MLSLERTTATLCHATFFAIALLIKNGGTFLAYKMDVRLHFKRRKEMDQGKMQGSGQFEMGGALGKANIITTLFFSWG